MAKEIEILDDEMRYGYEMISGEYELCFPFVEIFDMMANPQKRLSRCSWQIVRKSLIHSSGIKS